MEENFSSFDNLFIIVRFLQLEGTVDRKLKRIHNAMCY